MNWKMELGLAVLVVVIVAAVASFIVIPPAPEDVGEDNKIHLAIALDGMRTSEADYPSRLLILGNADLDDDLDGDDLKVLESLISNGYVYTKDYMADANYDGLIDQRDIDYLKGLISMEENIVYYLNVDFKIASYNKSFPLNLANILTQTLESECILCPDNIVATDERCYKGGSMGTFYREFESVLDYSKLSNIGSHKTADFEDYAVVAKNNGGYLTVWMNSEYTYNNGYIDRMFKGTTVQIVRLPSWEKAATISGILTAGYLFDKPGNNTAWDNAVTFTAWYDSLDGIIKSKAASIPENERKKVISASYSSSDTNTYINGSLAGEHMNVARIGIDDVTSKYFADNGITGTWYATLSKEELSAFYQQYGLDLVVGSIAAPYNAGMKELVAAYNQRQSQISSLPGVQQMTIGWIFGSGPSELIYCILVGKAAYPELYSDMDVEEICNQFLKFLGTYGTGEKQWTYDKLELVYYGGS